MISLKYFSLIGLDADLKQKADQIKNNLSNLNGFKPQKVFVTDYLQTDRTKVFENLLFFADDVVYEIKNFSAEERYAIYKIKDNVTMVQILKNDHNFKNFDESSRIYIRVSLRFDAELELKGTGENCRFLMDLLNTVFLKEFEDSKKELKTDQLMNK